MTIAVVTQQLVPFTDDCLGAEIRTATATMNLTEEVMTWIIDTRSLDCLANAVIIALTLGVAFEYVVAHSLYTATR